MNITGARKALGLLINTLDTTKRAVSPIDFPERKPLFKPNDEKYFERVMPEECGISSNHVAEFVSELIDERTVGLQNLMLMRGNKVFFEADIGRQDSSLPKATFSECKSIIALAIGSLVTHGQLKLSEKVTDILSDKVLPVAKIRLKNLTVKHLLTMTAAVNFNETDAIITSDWVKGFLNADTDGEIGKNFKYNSLNSYILSAIIKERTEMSVSDYLNKTIFGALGITDYYWETCPNGIEKGGWGLFIRREDIAKIGLLVMQNGVWNGKKLISPKFIEDATKAQIETPKDIGNYNYGFHIWRNRDIDSYLFNGMLGQNLIGYRENGIIITANCGNCDIFQKNAFFDICDRYFGKKFPNEMPTNNADFEKLNIFKETLKGQRKIESFLGESSYKRDIEADINAIDGKMFKVDCPSAVSTGAMPLLMQFLQSNFTSGLKEIGFKKTDSGISVEFIEENEKHIINVGFGEPQKSNLNFNGEIYTVSAEGFFCVNEDNIPVLKIDCDFIETPYSRCYKFLFENGNHRAIFSEKPAGNAIDNVSELFALLGNNGQKIETVFSKIDGDYITVKLEKIFSPKLVLVEK